MSPYTKVTIGWYGIQGSYLIYPSTLCHPSTYPSFSSWGTSLIHCLQHRSLLMSWRAMARVRAVVITASARPRALIRAHCMLEFQSVAPVWWEYIMHCSVLNSGFLWSKPHLPAENWLRNLGARCPGLNSQICHSLVSGSLNLASPSQSWLQTTNSWDCFKRWSIVGFL